MWAIKSSSFCRPQIKITRICEWASGYLQPWLKSWGFFKEKKIMYMYITVIINLFWLFVSILNFKMTNIFSFNYIYNND